jgi:phosphoserine phosphatase
MTWRRTWRRSSLEWEQKWQSSRLGRWGVTSPFTMRMQPSRHHVEDLLEKEPLTLTPGISDLIQILHERGQDVHFVSGGFRQMIEPVAAQVGVSKDRIHANTFVFNDDGSFKCHLDTEPTSRAGGKAKVVADLKASRGYKTVVMIGDGATDMEARDVEGGADAFIGFGGIAVREKVKAGADWFVTDFADLVAELEYDTSDAETAVAA